MDCFLASHGYPRVAVSHGDMGPPFGWSWSFDKFGAGCSSRWVGEIPWKRVVVDALSLQERRAGEMEKNRVGTKIPVIRFFFGPWDDGRRTTHNLSPCNPVRDVIKFNSAAGAFRPAPCAW